MKKEISQYLHLYLGCELVSKSTNEMVGVLLGIVGNEAYFKINGVFYSSVVLFYKPILRPLSDMSEEEKIEQDYLINLKFAANYKNEDSRVIEARITKYLLSKHFDLFGLIEAGLAIDATTLK